MAGTRVGIIGAGGVGVAAASAIIIRGLASRVTIYARKPDAARGLALDFDHARPLLSRIDIRGRGLDEIEEEDVLVFTAGHHTQPGETRLDILHKNLDVMNDMVSAVEAGELPKIALVVTNPLDVMTEYLSRRWAGRPVSVMGSGTSLDTLRLTQRIAQECGVHPRSVHGWVIGEHGDSSVFLLDSATVGTVRLVDFAAQRGVDMSEERLRAIERDVREAAYQVRALKGSAVHGIGLTVSGLIHASLHETGALIPVSVRVGDDVSASLPCVLGPEGPSAPLMPTMTERERQDWDHSLAVLAEANEALSG
ncbi:MAG: L-lactate dehydrogenase [Acidimicrobiia bacterium]|nr:L-lactate dehydrogenase [Acidimicrobiia bacterium]